MYIVGEKCGYHGITLGLYLDQIVRRVDTQHRDLAGFFADEIARPYGELYMCSYHQRNKNHIKNIFDS